MFRMSFRTRFGIYLCCFNFPEYRVNSGMIAGIKLQGTTLKTNLIRRNSNGNWENG